MPTAALSQIIDRRRTDDAAYLADIAAQLRVAPSALAWRLFNLRWIDKSMVEALKAERQRLAQSPKRFSPSFVGMLHRAIDRGQLSARKAARTMGMNLSQLAELFAEHSMASPFEL